MYKSNPQSFSSKTEVNSDEDMTGKPLQFPDTFDTALVRVHPWLFFALYDGDDGLWKYDRWDETKLFVHKVRASQCRPCPIRNREICPDLLDAPKVRWAPL